MKQRETRAIECIVDEDKRDIIQASDVLGGPDDRISHIRAEATRRIKSGTPRYFCGKCGHPVFVRYDPKRTPHFYHRNNTDTGCEWYSGNTRRPDYVDAQKYNGVQEGPLHQKLKEEIVSLTASDTRFQWVRSENRVTSDDTGQWKRPDVVGQFREHSVVFELQLATTHNQVIVDREEFYKANGIFIVWVFYNFDCFKINVTARDIYDRNHGNAVEIDTECIELSRLTGKLMLKIHWQEPIIADGILDYEWQSKIIDMDELIWDATNYKPYLSNKEEKRIHLLREHHRDLVDRIEQGWINNRDVYTQYQGEASTDLPRISEILSIKPAISWDQIMDMRFDRVIDTLFAIKTGRNHYTNQDMIGVVDTALNNWRRFTNIIVAALTAYNRSDVLNRPSIQQKISSNLREAQEKVGRSIQRDEYNPIVHFLFPELSSHLPWYS